MVTILRRRQELGQAHSDVDPESFGRQMVAIWDGLQTQWLYDQSFDLPKAVADAFLDLSRANTMLAKKAIEDFAAEL